LELLSLQLSQVQFSKPVERKFFPHLLQGMVLALSARALGSGSNDSNNLFTGCWLWRSFSAASSLAAVVNSFWQLTQVPVLLSGRGRNRRLQTLQISMSGGVVGFGGGGFQPGRFAFLPLAMISSFHII
jgi:hypothetical protein